MTSNYTPGALTALTLPAGGRLLVGHVSASDRHDPDVPIPAREYRWPAFFADARCTSCPAKSELSYQGTEALMLVIHNDGCPQLAALLAEMGARRARRRSRHGRKAARPRPNSPDGAAGSAGSSGVTRPRPRIGRGPDDRR